MRSDCPLSYSLDFFGDKWTLLIVRDMVFDGKRFYKEFLASKEGMATNILSDRLKKLESNGIIESRTYEKLKTRKEYTLTEKGRSLVPVLVEMMVWSARHQDGLAISKQFLRKWKKDRAGVLDRIRLDLTQ